MPDKQVTSPVKRGQFSDRKQRIFDYLCANPLGVLSTTDSDGKPHGSVVYFCVNRDFRLFFLTRTETRKYDNLKHNDHLAITVFEPHSQSTAQVIGNADELAGDDALSEVMAAISDASIKMSGTGELPISKLEAGEYVAFRVTPSQIRLAVYARPDIGRYEDIFESLESFDLDLPA